MMNDQEIRMNVFSMKMLRAVGALAAVWLSVTAASAQTATAKMVSAANTFLSTLSEKQRQSVLYSFDDEQQRARWSNFPDRICSPGRHQPEGDDSRAALGCNGSGFGCAQPQGP